MADTGKQSPLGQNVLGGLLQNRCLQINPNAEYYMGISTSNSQYTYGALVENTVLRMLTWAINDGFTRGVISDSTYNNLISISGNGTCHALGNSKPPTYVAEDKSESWAGKTEGSFDCKSVEFGESAGVAGSRPGPANAGYSVTGDTDYGQQATWLPYNTTNPNKSITQWGWIRCHALQAHNEFNYHAKEGSEGQLSPPKYESFAGSFNEASSFANYTNKTISISENAQTFLEGTFSNMDDLITGDITGVSLYTDGLAYDLQNLQKVFDFKRLDRFGYPSTLLQQLHESGGLTQDLNLNLGSAGLSAKEIRTLSTAKTHGTPEQERKIYTAYLGITGDNLVASVSTLTDNSWFLHRCSFIGSQNRYGIRTLADILNPFYLFYNSNKTLTVPVYNDELGRPTGSKTYYLIYNDDGSVNSAINTTNVKNIVGTLFTDGPPAPSTSQSKETPTTTLPKGFDSYLGGPNVVVPAEIGLACAAVRYSFLQISNIEQITPGKLGNCLKNLQILDAESVGSGANGTQAGAGNNPASLQKPVDENLVETINEEMGLGSGYAGTYRMDDFFGCMSGNPYWWESVFNYLAGSSEIQNVTGDAYTSELAAIYQQLFLAVSWEAGTGSVQTTLRAEETGIGTGEYDYFYTVTGVTLVNDGGGYGRGGAPDPVAVISGTSGATATLTIGRSDKDTGSNDAGTFGRITSFILTSAGIEVEYASAQPSATPTDPGLTVAIETPPIGTYAWLPATGATNSPDGTAYNYDTVTQYYITAANNFISNLSNNVSEFLVRDLNALWDVMGKQMKVEQRTRYNALGRVEIPRDPFVYTNQDIVSWVDNIPEIVKPESVYDVIQGRITIELIVDRACNVGQNIVAMMRESNNEQALANCGIPLNNNISDKIPQNIQDTLHGNGTFPRSNEGIPVGDIEWVNPGFPDIFGPDGPQIGPGGKYVSPTFVPIEKSTPGSIDPILNNDPNPQVGPVVADGPPELIISTLPPLFTGDPDRKDRPEGGQGDGSNAGGGQPGAPNPPFIPLQTVDSAIEKVIHCNCDCWDLIS
jgi:hypothetical protein|tara:strand:+ start:7 stop:3138 length:3132 start_codon:yes stop_codon:yes gene_type:complete